MFHVVEILSHILMTLAGQIIAAAPDAAPTTNIPSTHAHGASQPAATGPQANEAFQRLRSMVGTWDMTATLPTGRSYTDTVIYRMASGGSVLFEEIGPEASMLTTYHFDKGLLVLTHYCTVGNQPRMRLRSSAGDGRTLAFDIYDITNLARPDAYHSTNLEISFLNQNRVRLIYTGMSGGRNQRTIFDLRRVS